MVPGSLTLVGGDPGKPAIIRLPCHPPIISICWRKHAQFCKRDEKSTATASPHTSEADNAYKPSAPVT